ncbi:hypothetical protein CLV70_14617, partial [Pseudosporangium ferrugineum]
AASPASYASTEAEHIPNLLASEPLADYAIALRQTLVQAVRAHGQHVNQR